MRIILVFPCLTYRADSHGHGLPPLTQQLKLSINNGLAIIMFTETFDLRGKRCHKNVYLPFKGI